MNNTTKLCLTAITITLIWFLAQPFGGNMSIEMNLDKVPYFNLTNSTISGHAEISGYMPIGFVFPTFVAELVSSDESILVFYLVVVGIFVYYIFKAITQERRR